ncbi:uncharacterized protein N7482_002917 [Penicillium canariense]|uniref:Major facilitator superfamily (MFS) profile domain-containing protein n=1 Tax=Penicillium canariense TaxID=189055 RepID=A0A9W9IJY5_9EURO|nr:uncharacterized protein N7482_002917 [Penicillium canariense]KAJ5177040.1 hypothetical protein N7482_002917 [Penicillium canariense]
MSKPEDVPSQSEAHSSTYSKERDLETGTITQHGPDDPENPRNWPSNVKWHYTLAVSVFTFISPVSSAMIAPALDKLGKDLHMTSKVENNLALSIFVLAYAIGPLVFGPASEVYGRVRLLQFSNLWYLAWNLGCGFAQTPAEFFVFRFLAGLGGGAPLALGGAAISDVWDAEHRGKAMGIYTLAPMLGPVIGPIAGAFISQNTTWRWVFWSSSAAAVAIQVVGLIWLHESHPATLLKWKRNRLAKETGNDQLHTSEMVEPLIQKIRGAMIRPVGMITTQPIIAVTALYLGYLFGISYLMVTTIPDVWAGWYGESEGIAGLNYISIAIGSFAGLFLNVLYIDRIYQNLKAKNGNVGCPEFRMPTMFIGSFIFTAGLFWYGWSVQGHVHWIMPNVGVVIFAAGTMGCLQGMQMYIIDCYTTYAASAMSACALLRSLAGFGFPLFAPYLYSDLGYRWGTSVLAFISMAIGIPASIVFWKYGAKLRAMSTYASG